MPRFCGKKDRGRRVFYCSVSESEKNYELNFRNVSLTPEGMLLRMGFKGLLCENQRAAHHGLELRLGLKIASPVYLLRPSKDHGRIKKL